MPPALIAYPDIPQDTRQAASQLYGRGNIYLRLGDHLDELVAGLIPPEMKCRSEKSSTQISTMVYALLTVFQFVEELADGQMFYALHNRVELKYALHLPMDFASLDPAVLCQFRLLLLSDPSGQKIFQALLDRLGNFGLFAAVQDRPVAALELLTTILRLNQLHEVLDVMHRALESLALTDPDWLRQAALPNWYERYSRTRRWRPISCFSDKWESMLSQITADIQYLLKKIDQSHNPVLSSVSEIRELRHIWKRQSIVNPERAEHENAADQSST